MKATIMHVINDLRSDGAQTCLFRLVMHSDRSKFRHVVVAFQDGDLKREMIRFGVRVHLIAESKKGLAVPGVRRIVKVIRSENPDCIQGWMYRGNLAACVGKGVKREAAVLWNVRTAPNVQQMRVRSRLLLRFSVAFSGIPNRIVYNSQRSCIAHEILGYPHRKSAIIHNGVPLDVFTGREKEAPALKADLEIPRDDTVVTYLKRFDPKGNGADWHLNFVRAAGVVRSRMKNVSFLCVGRGTTLARNRFTGEMERLGLKDKVRFVEHMGDVRPVFAISDIVVSASGREGFPNAIAEAMASGVPCVVTDVGDSGLLVGDTGLVVPYGSHLELGHAILRLVEEGRQRRRERGTAAKARIGERFSVAQMVYAYEKVYEEVLG